jgi:tetratricopeptide (TPR) repeat protein
MIRAGTNTTRLALAALFALIAGCARQTSREAPAGNCACEEPSARPVDTKLMAWLSKARTLHHMADLGEEQGALDRAIAPLEQLVGGATPPGPSPEVDEVLADTYARLGDLRARRGELERAEADIEKGLERAPGTTYFRGHLLEVRGLVYEKLSASLAKAGKGAEAEEARQKAVRASAEAVRIQDEVIAGTLDKEVAPSGAASGRPAATPNKRD